MAYPYQDLFRVRTVTCFLTLQDCDFVDEDHDETKIGASAAVTAQQQLRGSSSTVADKLRAASDFLRSAERTLTVAGYTVQTVRIATNPFGEWGLDATNVTGRLHILDGLLEEHGIQFCALGPAVTVDQVRDLCVPIVTAASGRFSCSAQLQQNDVEMAMQCASTIRHISLVSNNNNEGTTANFRFCVAAAAVDNIPFFPVAKAGTSSSDNSGKCQFAIGLENGALARKLLTDCGSIRNVPTVFSRGFSEALAPLQKLCRDEIESSRFEFAGIDTSLNPSLDAGGSVAAAMECLEEVGTFGGPGTLAAAATVTQTLQSLPGIQNCGYSGLMLPVCEDQRLAELTSSSSSNSALRISNLLSISQVCGVGVDTVPVPGDCTEKELATLLLDVAGMAHRWNKSLSCRVFPVVGKGAGDWTTFDSPYMVNARILSLAP